jgi:hypothetical protein
MRKQTLLSAVLTLSLTAPLAWAEQSTAPALPPMAAPNPMMQQHFAHQQALRELDQKLTQAQDWQAYQALMQQRMQLMQTQQQEMQALRQEQMQQWQAQRPAMPPHAKGWQGKGGYQSAEIAELRQAQQARIAEMKAFSEKMRNAQTPAERQQLMFEHRQQQHQAMMEQRQQRMQERGGMGMGQGHGPHGPMGR